MLQQLSKGQLSKFVVVGGRWAVPLSLYCRIECFQKKGQQIFFGQNNAIECLDIVKFFAARLVIKRFGNIRVHIALMLGA